MDTNIDIAFRLKVSAKEESLLKLLGPFENHIMALQSVLVWEDPRYSSALFVAVHVLFWLACTVQVFYMVGIVGSVTVFLNMWTNHIWPEIKVPLAPGEETEEWTPVHPRLLSVHELVSHLAHCVVVLEDYVQAAIHLRRDRRTIFFLKAMVCLTCTAVLGHYVPGVYLAYFSVIAVLLIPCAVYNNWSSHLSALLHPYISQVEAKMNIKRHKKGRKKGTVEIEESLEESDDDEIASFIPTSQESTSSLLSMTRDSDDEGSGFTPRLLTPVRHSPSNSQYSADFDDETLDLSLTPHIDEMPSINSSLSSFLPDISLMPTMDGALESHHTTEDNEQDTTIYDDDTSSSEKSDSVNFVSSHFNDDGSVEDEAHLEEGMDFSAIDSDSMDGQQVFQQESVGLLAAGQNMISAAMANPVIQDTVSKATPLITGAVSSMLASTRSGMQTLADGVSRQFPDKSTAAGYEYSGSDVAEEMAEALRESRDVTPVEEQELLEEFEFLNREDVDEKSDEDQA